MLLLQKQNFFIYHSVVVAHIKLLLACAIILIQSNTTPSTWAATTPPNMQLLNQPTSPPSHMTPPSTVATLLVLNNSSPPTQPPNPNQPQFAHSVNAPATQSSGSPTTASVSSLFSTTISANNPTSTSPAPMMAQFPTAATMIIPPPPVRPSTIPPPIVTVAPSSTISSTATTITTTTTTTTTTPIPTASIIQNHNNPGLSDDFMTLSTPSPDPSPMTNSPSSASNFNLEFAGRSLDELNNPHNLHGSNIEKPLFEDMHGSSAHMERVQPPTTSNSDTVHSRPSEVAESIAVPTQPPLLPQQPSTTVSTQSSQQPQSIQFQPLPSNPKISNELRNEADQGLNSVVSSNDSQPSSTTSVNQSESRKPIDTTPSQPMSIEPASRSTQPSSANSVSSNSNSPQVQILKPKSKFKCFQQTDCKNGALCHNGMCFCLPGFTGESCDINIDECRQFDGGKPCLNNGTCVDEINQFRCDCQPGFRGERCQDLADMCNDSPCLNGAKCLNYRTHYTCKCEPGWDGQHCEIDIDDCAKNPCQNNATCHDLVNNYRCECPPGFNGTNCEININDCASNPCQNNATCRDLINDFECECANGFAGKNCEENIDDCASSPCYHGDCTDLIGGFECTCHDGYTGKQCEHDINECESGAKMCLNGGTCENIEASYRCHCREGFAGKKCGEISDFCKAKQPCGKHGTCKNSNITKGFKCECSSGHIGSRCESRRDCYNECSSHHAQCVSNVTCACLPGKREERTMCEYVSSCEQIDGDLCLNGGACKNLDTGGYQCICQDPYYGPICQFVAEKPQFDAILLIVITCVGLVVAACSVVSIMIFRSVRKARATRGTYSPSTQEKFGNSASDLLKPPVPERLI